MSEKKQSVETLNPPEEFYKIINDFTTDMLTTFPEYSGIISRWWNRPSENVEESRRKEVLFVFRHCVNKYPERFFDILYKNDEIFKEESEINTEFLPGIVFKQLWNLDILDTTKETMWKYLQLILFAVVGSVHDGSAFGDSAKLFEAINEEELKSKIEETLENMQNMFENGSNGENPINMEGVPNAEQLHDHINSMMGGKLGKLALELAEETAQDLNLDMENVSDTKDVFQKLFKNPGKMMGMVKNISSKIDAKIKSGELNESEIMEEGMELLNKMKNMPGMENMQQMFSQMGIPGLGKGAKINMNAMEAQLQQNLKNAKMKERLRAKANNYNKNSGFCNMSSCQEQLSEQEKQALEQERKRAEVELYKVFSTGEKVEKTPRRAKLATDKHSANATDKHSARDKPSEANPLTLSEIAISKTSKKGKKGKNGKN